MLKEACQNLIMKTTFKSIKPILILTITNADKQMNWRTANWRTGEQANRRTGEQANRRKGEQANRRTGEQTNRQAARQRQAGKNFKIIFFFTSNNKNYI